MSPILGIWASGVQGSKASSFDSIATVTGTGSSGTITFSSIPQTYKHLQVRAITRSSGSNIYNSWYSFRVNGDTGSNYASHYLSGDGTSAIAGGNASTTSLGANFYSPGSDSTTGTMGVLVLDILDYTNTNKYKTTRALQGNDQNTSSTRIGIDFDSGLWMNTSAITSISFTLGSSQLWTTSTQFALYGIKG